MGVSSEITMKTNHQLITDALALASRLDGLRAFGPEHFTELQSAVNTIRSLISLIPEAQESTAPTKAPRCRFFEFGTAPRAGELGYYLARTTCGTDMELLTKFREQDVILVRGAVCSSKIGTHEYAVFVPAPSYTVLSLHKTMGWYEKAIEAGLWPRGDNGQMSERTWVIQDADVNRMALTQHKLRDLPLDTTGFDASQQAIAAKLASLGLLVRTDATGAQDFDPSASFDSPDEALALIKKQTDPLKALMAVIEFNLRVGEAGFVGELVAQYDAI